MGKRMTLIPTSVILNALEGDETALFAIVKHYECYIQTLSTRHYTDDYGNEYLFVDDNIRIHLESKLLLSIVTKFKPSQT